MTGRPAAGRARYVDRQTGPGVGLLAPAGPETADVRVFEGRTLAPHRMRLRVLETIAPSAKTNRSRCGTRSCREGGPPRSSPAGAPSSPRPAVRAFRAAERVARPAAVVRAVPARGAHDRRRRAGSATASLPHPARRAMRRAENAIPILRRSDLGQLGELLVDLHQWIAAFDPRSILELDYGELCDLIELGRDGRRPQRRHDPAGARCALEARAERVGRGLPVGARALGGVRSREMFN